MQVWFKILAVVALSAFTTATSANPPDSFAISVKLTHAGHSFAEPAAVVLAGKPASFEVAGPGGYMLTLTVTDTGASEIQIAANLHSAHGSMAPTLTVRPGQPASVRIGDLGLELMVSRNGG